jgi:23S rRNA (adenine2503-C2)-methyltransferase
MQEFEERLARRGVPVTVRDTRGTEIDGACGQLAARAVPVAGGTVAGGTVAGGTVAGGTVAGGTAASGNGG